MCDMATPRARSLIIDVQIIGNAAGCEDYVVTSNTGYWACLPKCDRDACRDGYIKACARPLNDKAQHETGGKNSVNAWLLHCKRHCHAWHDERVENHVLALRRAGHGSAMSSNRLVKLPVRRGR